MNHLKRTLEASHVPQQLRNGNSKGDCFHYARNLFIKFQSLHPSAARSALQSTPQSNRTSFHNLDSVISSGARVSRKSLKKSKDNLSMLSLSRTMIRSPPNPSNVQMKEGQLRKVLMPTNRQVKRKTKQFISRNKVQNRVISFAVNDGDLTRGGLGSLLFI